MDSNPIQQRIEEFEQKYLEIRYTQAYKYLILRTAQDDWEMLEAFYDYMLGIDNEVEDVVLVFQSALYQVETYSQALVEELFAFVLLWNYADKPDSIEHSFIDWKMNRSLSSTKNTAALFVANINAFCQSVTLEEDSNIVCVLHYQNKESRPILHWLKDLAQLELHPSVTIVLSDTFEDPLFNAFKDYSPKATQILPHRFELNQAIKEIAAMGDPNTPDTKYRYHMVQLHESINKQREKEVHKHANFCLEIADQNKENDANWYVQKMLVYSTWSTFEFSKKQFKQAVKFIDLGIDSLLEVKGKLVEDMVDRLLGQGFLFRGNLYLLLKENERAQEDFMQGELHYINCQDYLMQIESVRLIVQAAEKIGDKKIKYEALNRGIRLGVNLNPTLAQASTYTLLVKEVLAARYNSFISDSELDAIVKPLLGDQWRVNNKNVKSIMTKKEH
ncbi:hypothetical protein [Myroides fluvii]|uniref:hypothetical protein n=1 Tax=Myroides fluvii TaxID=2572594 RepID=UPI00131E2DD7|nr:hypothetical protein [Myroides fluvii]